MELYTDDFPLLLNRDFYKFLIENFKSIEGAYSQLEKDLQDETDARIGADGIERNGRIAQDTKLQTQINELDSRMNQAESNISDLQTRMKTVEEQIKKLNGIIFGYEYIDDTDLELLDDDVPQPSEMEINDDVAVDDDTAEVAESIPGKTISEVS